MPVPLPPPPPGLFITAIPKVTTNHGFTARSFPPETVIRRDDHPDPPGFRAAVDRRLEQKLNTVAVIPETIRTPQETTAERSFLLPIAQRHGRKAYLILLNASDGREHHPPNREPNGSRCSTTRCE